MKTIQSEFEKHGIKNQHHKRKKHKKKSNEKFSQNDLRELMGMNRPTYSRHKGAYRQR